MAILSNDGIRAGASGVGGDYEIEKSLRFDSNSTTPANTAFLNIEPSFTGMDDQKFTISMWIKLSELRQYNTILGHAISGGNVNYCTITTDALTFFANTINSSGAAEYQYFIADSVLTDPTAWFHLHIKGDLTLATESERLKISINGTALTANYYGADSQNSTYAVWPTATSDNTSGGLHLGRINHAAYGAYVGDMLLADVYVLNSAKDVSDFGEINSDTGEWNPIKYTGGYTSFDSHLKFNGTDLGEDSSGNDNDWTPSNFSTASGIGNDTSTDTPTNYGDDTGLGGEVRGNYATLNPLHTGHSTLSNGNLTASGTGDMPTIIPGSGQWYYEIGTTGYNWDGTAANFTSAAGDYNFGQRPFSGTPNSGHKALCTTNLPDPTIVDPSKHFDVATDTGANILSAATALTDGADFVWIKDRANNSTNHILFNRINDTGMDGTPHLRSNEGDNETTCGTYSAPTGNSVAWAWNAGTTNDTTAAGDLNSSAYNRDQLWTENWSQTSAGTYLSGSGLTGMEPSVMFSWPADDYTFIPGNSSGAYASGSEVTFTPNGTTGIPCSSLVIKAQSGGTGGLYVNGVDRSSYIGSGYSEKTVPMPSGETHLKTLKFTTDNGSNYIQTAYIKVDGKYIIDSGESVTNIPTIASTYRANPNAGFSIVSYTGNRTANTQVAHGLNAKADFIIFKNRTQTDNWGVYHKENGPEKFLYLNSSNANGDDPGFFSDTDGNSNCFIVGDEDTVNGTSETMIAYCWSEVDGYSSFGSYTGNGTNGDGPFVYCGFKPRFIIFKRTDSIGHWMMYDTKRDDHNEMDKSLSPSQDTNETSISSNDEIDVVSNGFKHRSNHSTLNDSAPATYIYAAFAEHPFKYSRAR